MPRNAAKRDLKDKLKLEKGFKVAIDGYFDRVVAAMGKALANRISLNVQQQFGIELELLLKEHYVKTEKVFGDRIRPTLPNDIKATEQEDALINNAFLSFNAIRSPAMSKNINDTTQKDVAESILLAQTFDTETDELIDGRVISKKNLLVGFELILTAKAILKRKLFGRTSSIVMTETEIPAEVAKLTEAEVLSGFNPSLLGGDARPSTVTKIWVTMGDSLVRDAHLAADGQERPMNKPFNVGGDLLRVPGDSSLGASLSNIINCRCSSSVNTGEIISIRTRKLEDDTFEDFFAVGSV